MDFFKLAIDTVRVIFNKIHLSLCTASLRRLLPSFTPRIWTFWGLVIVKGVFVDKTSLRHEVSWK